MNRHVLRCATLVVRAALVVITVIAIGPASFAHAQTCVDYGDYAHWVGSLDIPQAARVAVDGNYAFVSRLGQLDIVNISDPAALTSIASLSIPGTTRDVSARNGFAYVALDSAGLKIVDATNPVAPFVASTLITPGPAQGVTVSGGLAFVACGSAGLQVVDVSNPAAPAIVGAIDTPGFAFSVALTGNLACLIDRDTKLHIIDVSNPQVPTIVGGRVMPGRVVAAAGSRVYVVGGEVGGVSVIDISNPAAPYELSIIYAQDEVNDVMAVGETVYIAYGSYYPEPPCGVLIVDASSGSAPTVVGKLVAGSKILSVAYSAGHVFAIQSIWDSEGFLHAFAIPSTTTAPLIGISPDTGTTSVHVALRETKAYVVEQGPFNQNHRLRVLNIASPSAPIVIGQVSMSTRPEAIALSGNYAYVAGSEAGVVVVDISGSPVVVGMVGIDGNARDIAVAGHYAYVTEGSGGLTILDITNQAAPTFAGGVSLPGNSRRLEVAGSHVYIDSYEGVQVVDVSNPTAPVFAGLVATPMAVRCVDIQGNIGVAGFGEQWDLGQVVVMDMTNAAAPVVIASVPTPAFVFDVKLDGPNLYVSTLYLGVLVFDISNPYAPVVIGGTGVSEWQRRMEVSQGVLFLTGDSEGLKILPTQCAASTGVDSHAGTEFVRALLPAWPNPMRATTTLRFDLPGSDDVRLEIFDASGRRVRSIVQGRLAAGHHSIRWDGLDDDGAAVGSGLYLVGLSSSRGTATSRVTLIR